MKSQIQNNCCVIFNVKVHQQVKIPLTTLYLYFSIKPPMAVNYVEDIFLSREYDRPHHVSARYTRCNIQENDFALHYTKKNVKPVDSNVDPHIYVECIFNMFFLEIYM